MDTHSNETPLHSSENGDSANGKFRRVFRTLRYRNYRLFFSGQLISLIGTWMQQVALTWLVYRLTHSPLLLGVVGFSSQMPTFLLSSFTGVLADRWNRHRILVATQILSMLQASALAALTLTDHITVPLIILLSVTLGIINSFDMPTRQTFVLDMIENKQDLSNAIALNSSMFNGARLVGPSIAGMLIAAVGEGWCFAINAISYIAVIGALLSMRIQPPPKREKQPLGIFAGLREGFQYAYYFLPIRSILMFLALISLVGMPYVVLMPVFAKDIFHGGPHTLGFMVGATGIGAVTGALLLASRKNIMGLGKYIPIAGSIFGTGLILFALIKVFWLSLILLFFMGMSVMVQMAVCNSILQTIADDDKRGRVMSFYTMSFMGMAPMGSLLAGYLAGVIGAPATFALSGVFVVAGAGVFAFYLPAIRAMVVPIYQRLGILPEVSKVLQAATHLTIPPED